MNFAPRSNHAALTIVGGLILAFAAASTAQVQTETSTSSGHAAKEVKVTSGTVLLVDGNDLIIKLDDGTIRHFPNVPESRRINVGGKMLGIHDLKPGMVLTRTTVTTTTPQLITTVQTVTGKVWHVNPPLSVILTLEDGTNQQFKIPNGQKFNINGQMVDAWGLKKGMTINATRVVEVPQTLVTQKNYDTGTAPPPPPPDQPILVAVISPPPSPAPAAPAPAAPAALPKTASPMPLIGLLGVLLLGGSFSLRLLRRV